MKKFALKKPGSSNPNIWEWKTHQPIENSPVVKLVYFDTQEDAQVAGQSWGQGFEIVEVNLPD